jgi:hypothetical protein
MNTQTFNAVELSSFNEVCLKIKTVTGIDMRPLAEGDGIHGQASANGYKLIWDYNPTTKHFEITVLDEPTPGSLGSYLDKLLGKGLDGRDAEER